MNNFNKTYLASALFCALALSNTYAKNTDTLSLTIYNNNLALINETKNINIKNAGLQEFIYEGISPNIIFESVRPEFSKKTELYSQNYKYDVLSLNKLLQVNLGKTIKYKNSENKDDLKTYTGKLMALNPVVIKTSKGIISNIKRTDIIFDSIPKSLITKPSLVWNAKFQKGKQQIKVNYLTRGISWKTDYILKVSDENKDNSLSAWISINNNSGTQFKNAQIYCIAGEVNTKKIERPVYMEAMSKSSRSYSAPRNIKAKSLSAYKIYKIPFKETLNNKEKKQISFINVKNLKYKQYASFESSIIYNRINKREKIPFINEIRILNKKENSLGISLPSGTVRVYKQKDEISHFIGQDHISNTSINDEIKLKIGKYFDITQDILQTTFVSRKNYRKSAYTRIIKNNSNKKQRIEIRENTPNHIIKKTQLK